MSNQKTIINIDINSNKLRRDRFAFSIKHCQMESIWIFIKEIIFDVTENENFTILYKNKRQFKIFAKKSLISLLDIFSDYKT